METGNGIVHGMRKTPHIMDVASEIVHGMRKTPNTMDTAVKIIHEMRRNSHIMEKGGEDLPALEMIAKGRLLLLPNFENYFHIYFSPPVIYNMRTVFNLTP